MLSRIARLPVRPATKRPLSRRLPMLLAAATAAHAGLGGVAAAQSASPGELREITNTATRTERRTDEVPATVTVTPAGEGEARGARDLKELFRNEVDLSVRAASPRFGAALGTSGRAGNEGLNVRGLEGNQVLLVVDGIRVPASFSFGAFATGRLDYLALDTAHTVEVLRGPAGTQFGSDGLAGALAVRTLEAADLLRPGSRFNGHLRITDRSVDDSIGASTALAWRSGRFDALLVLAGRDGRETDTQGTNAAPDARRTAPNPLAYSQSSALAKLGVDVTPAHRLSATVETLRRTVATDVVSARTAPPPAPAPLPATAVLRLDASDRIQRDRVSLHHRFDDLNAPWLQKAATQIYVQDARTTQLSLEDRNTAADRIRDNRYREEVAGFATQGEASFAAPVAQRISGGVDASRTRVTGVRDGTVPPFGESFPTKPFPDTRYTLVGAFAQSEVQLGALTVIPALRYDRFELDPSQEGYTAGVVTPLSGDALTPRLGAVWKLGAALAPYAQWSRGFRAPTPDQVNNGFTNAASGYRSIGNPDLRPERADSRELGLRGQAGALRWQVAAYDNRYTDFISQQQVSGSLTPADPGIFQFVNLASARIRGGELRLRYDPTPAWQLRAAAATARGRTARNGTTTPLNTIEPTKVSLGTTWRRDGAFGRLTLRADVLHADGKDPARIANPAPPAAPLFAPPSFTTLDLGIGWQQGPVSLHLNVDNALDRTYWRWSDVRGVAADSTVKDAFTAPGRSVSLVLRADF